MYKDEVKEETHDPDSTVRKIVNEEIMSSEKISDLQACLRNKDKRLKKVEERWSAFVDVLAGIALVGIGILWFVTLVHISNYLPWPVTTTVTESSQVVNVSDWWLLIGESIMYVTSYIGIYAAIYLAYAIATEGKKKED